nr:decaprenyl-phosphate phosphoribosyltransferase [Naasia aerilata]
MLHTARPRQWLKNLLVFAAPLVGARILELDVALATIVAFAAFCLSASAVYFVNDVLDVESDRAHPKKRHRPIPSGSVPIPIAIAAAVLLFAAGLGISFFANWQLVVVMAVYDVVQLAYCFWLKHQPILDIAVVSSGFLLRMIAGGAATGIALSRWFLLVAVFGSLLMVAGKRYAEILAQAERTGEVRGSLKGYTQSYLGFAWHSAATILILGYSLWAFETFAGSKGLWISLSVAPFILAVLRYCQHIDRGDAEAPEDIAIGDRLLQIFAAAWLVILALAIYFPA